MSEPQDVPVVVADVVDASPDAPAAAPDVAGGAGAAPYELTAAAAPPSLWRDRTFLTFWGGQGAAQLGSQITEIALPVVAVVLLSATEQQMGWLNAAGVAAFLLVGLPAGAWVDRWSKRRTMMAADLVRVVALAAVPVLWFTGSLELWHLLVVAAVVGLANVFFDVAYQSIVPALVPRPSIPDANGKLESTAQVAGIAGPGIGGWLVGLLSAPGAMLVTAGGYVASFVALAATRVENDGPTPKADRPALLPAIRDGVRWVFGNPWLRRIVATTAISNFFSTMTFTLLPLFLLRDLGFTALHLGLVFGAGSVGGLVGAVLAPRIALAVGEMRAIPLGALAFGVPASLLPLVALVPGIATPVLLLYGFAGSFGVLLYNVVQVSFRQRITPHDLLGRMNASIRFVVWGVMPISALLAGWLGSELGVLPVLWIAAGGALASTLPVLGARFWRAGAVDVDRAGGAPAGT
ncbi:MAG: MFS transporter [Micrococcales bacterium 73-15]|uniref:MFS transporter n=1 Tax=Salana multivorans TaxID=120377 RepID=UPI00095C33D2|nr:MFS transporter [Salana multivorans]OJX97802.1 MAG: MFS transporter [Micrococcales bacterium 73-15]